MEIWQGLPPEAKLAIISVAWVIGSWFVGSWVAALAIARLRNGGWDKELDWRWLEKSPEPTPVPPTITADAQAEPTSPATTADGPLPVVESDPRDTQAEDDRDTALRYLRGLIVISAMAFGVRQMATLYGFTPAIDWIERVVPVAWTLVAASAGALFAGNRILRPLLPIVFTGDVRDRLDRFYPVPKGEQTFAAATRSLVGWGVYTICFLALTTFFADLHGWTTARGFLSTTWRFLLGATTISLIWFVAARVLQGMDSLSKEHPDDSLSAGARATGRRAVVFGVAGLITCFALFDGAVWLIAPILFVGAGACAWALRNYLEDYVAGLYLRMSKIDRIRILGVPCQVQEFRPFASPVLDDSGVPRLIPNSRLVSAFRVDAGTSPSNRARSESPVGPAYVPPSHPPTAAPELPKTTPVDAGPPSASPTFVTGTLTPPAPDHTAPHPFGTGPSLPFDPDREYALPGTVPPTTIPQTAPATLTPPPVAAP
jgi:hypothetical protein